MKTDAILVPLNFREENIKSLQFAYQYAVKMGKRIDILHAYFPPITDHRMGGDDLKLHAELTKKHLEAKLKKWLDERKTDIGFDDKKEVPIQHLVQMGSLIDNINQYCDTNNCEMVVMNNSVSSKFSRFLFGSKVEEVVNRIHVPLLLVPNNSTVQLPKHLAFAVNFVEDNMLAVQQIDDFASVMQAKLTFLHVDNHVTEKDKLVHDAYRRALSKLVMANHVLEVIEHKDTSKALKNFLDTTEVDMLVMLKQQRGMGERLIHNSLTDRMVELTTKPLLVIQEINTLDN